MKNILKHISLYGWFHQKEEEDLNFLVVNFNRSADYNGAFATHYEAYDTNEFTTIEKAKEFIENRIPKCDLSRIRVYKMLKGNEYM